MSKYFIKTEEKVPDFYELSLKKVNISGNIIGKFGNFKIEQTFINNKTKPLEVNYTFPITETAVVTGFTVKIGDKVIRGICKEKEAARKEYVDSLSSGNSAYLLEQDTKNVFNVMVGKVLPNEEVKITINYIEMLSAVENKIRLIIPTLVNQRYKSKITDGLNYGKVDYTIDFNIRIQKALRYISIDSINHDIECSEDEEGFVQITAKNYDMSKDFVLDMRFKDELVSNAYLDNLIDSNNKVVLLNFMPEISYIDDSAKEYIFVVDVSGSMSCSKKIDKTKEGLKRCLKELREEDKFNIVPFSHDYTYYKKSSINATKENIEEVMKYIDSLEANGGTEILDPIKFALHGKEENKVIIVLTDGEVGNEETITNYISKNINSNRIFSIGIDTSVNTAFIKAMAKAGNGKAEFIYPDEDMEEAIVRTFKRIQTPIINNIKIDCGSSKLLGLIKEENALFNHEFFQAIVLLEDLQDDIVLKGKFADKELSWKIFKDDIKLCEENIRLIYAKKQIDLYEEQINSYEEDYYNKNAKTMVEEYKKKIIELSCKYNISSKYTSFISVNEREEKVFEPTVFENVTLSGAELYDDCCDMKMVCCESAMPYKGSKRCGASFSKYCLIDIPCNDYEVEEIFKREADTLDIYTFLLGIIYLYDFSSKLPLQRIFKNYMKKHEDKLNDETVQNLLVYMCKKNIYEKYILDNLLNGFAKTIILTNAPYDVDISKLDYGEDKSRKLDDGESLRERIVGEIAINL